ncbi:unnamed protein product, partial [Rotaria sordida]
MCILTSTIKNQIENCPLKQEHSNIGDKKLCQQCGFVPDCYNTGSHKGTSFRPLKWTVPEHNQTVYLICACKYTRCPPICDAT